MPNAVSTVDKNLANLKIAKAQQQEAMLNFRQSLLSAQLTAVQDKYDEAQGLIGLYHALGRGAE